jgi:hypothetical protein
MSEMTARLPLGHLQHQAGVCVHAFAFVQHARHHTAVEQHADLWDAGKSVSNIPHCSIHLEPYCGRTSAAMFFGGLVRRLISALSKDENMAPSVIGSVDSCLVVLHVPEGRH